jgi:hypothetical protein
MASSTPLLCPVQHCHEEDGHWSVTFLKLKLFSETENCSPF